jgi:ATP-dependent DNA helicase RecG
VPPERADEPLQLAELAAIPVLRLTTVTEKTAPAYERLGMANVLEVLTNYPRRYLDRTKQAAIGDLDLGESATLLVKVLSASTRTTRNRRSLTNVIVTDGTGRVTCTFFNQRWRERQLPPGTEVVIFGKLESYRGTRQMTNPVVDFVGDETGGIVPVYAQSEKEKVGTREIARLVRSALAKSAPRGFADPVPDDVLDEHDLITRGAAFEGIHRPETWPERDASRKRLVFDELLRVQLALVLRKRALERTLKGIRHEVDGPLVRAFRARLPYELTGAQERTIGEIDADLAGPHPMHRLLQGDVGSGKTVVAVAALLAAVDGGHQGALMAPTEVLAEQHHLGISALLDGLEVEEQGSLLGNRPLAVRLLTNRTPAAERKKLFAGLEDGTIDLVVGTHALIQDGIAFRSLGVAVIDEQHRFGVEQRSALRERPGQDTSPDVLVMTATPIPRTAAMTVYGDLDVSILDEMPPGRTPIGTTWIKSGAGGPDTLADTVEERSMWEEVRSEVAAGRQAYVVCPLIEESDKLEARSAEETFEALTAEGGELAGLEVGLLHGRVAPAEKEQTMARFRDGDLDVLVATTVIEVGVDVPNATVMVILDADRFGIAQLHQLRGRVGRGADASRCYLVGAGLTEDGEQRLAAMVRTTDGFELAEVDLDLRGEGTIMGERQKGRNDLKLASLRRDREWVEKARAVAFGLVDADPGLTEHEILREEVRLFLPDEDAAFLLKS